MWHAACRKRLHAHTHANLKAAMPQQIICQRGPLSQELLEELHSKKGKDHAFHLPRPFVAGTLGQLGGENVR